MAGDLEAGGLFSGRQDAIREYEDLARLADEVARELSIDGELVGRVSLQEPAGEGVRVLVPPEWWVKSLPGRPEALSIGSYLLAVDPKTLTAVLLVVEEVEYSRVGGAQPSQLYVDLEKPLPAAGEAVVPLVVKARPALLAKLGTREELRKNPGKALELLISGRAEVSAVSMPPSPNSPVAIPRPEVVISLVFSEATGDYYVAGALGVLDALYTAGGRLAWFPLPWSVARKHMLITGSTGSGKTSFVKNLIANIYYRHEYEGGPEADVLILDASGDYRVIVFPGSPRIESLGRVLDLYNPLWRRHRRAVKAVIAVPAVGGVDPKLYTLQYLEALTSNDLKSLAGRPFCAWDYSYERDPATGAWLLRVRIHCHLPGDGVDVENEFIVAPIAVKASPRNVLVKIVARDPYLTDRARDVAMNVHREIFTSKECKSISNIEHFLKIVIEGLERAKRSSKQEDPCTSLHKNPCARKVCEAAKGAHTGTLDNLIFRLKVLKTSRLVVNEYEEVLNADYGELVEVTRRLLGAKARVVVLDLDYPVGRLGDEVDAEQLKVTVGYMMLKSLADYRRSRPGRSFLVIDEAHMFFPARSGGGEEQENRVRRLTGEIERVTRLGRSLGISVIFSTHRHTDVNRIINTLANTKVYFRTDVNTARETELPRELRERLPFFRDHAAVVESYYVRGGYATLISAPSMLGHKLA